MLENKTVHLIGIGGVSMSSIALMLNHMHVLVTGSDTAESDLTQNLAKKGIEIFYGHHPEVAKNADIIVYTAAVHEDDPERKIAKELNIPAFERAEFLGKLMQEFKNNICISGTHGKSTTTGMVSLIFLTSNLNPTIQIGAMLSNINGNTHLGSNEYFVLEACEYVDSFLHFHPTSALITNIDNDHLDYFKNLDNIKKSFYKYVGLLPDYGFLVKNNDDLNSENLENYTKAQVITYGINNDSLYMAKNIKANNLGHYSFDIYYKNEFLITINLNINGHHNVYNALAAFALAHAYIDDIKLIKKGLELYRGVGRRFEYLGKCNGAYIYDDYAHHPSEIKTTYQSTLEIKHHETWAIFQSHTFSRTKAHLDEFAEVLSNFDHIIIAPIYPAREINTFNVSEDMLVDKIKVNNPNVIYLDSFDKISDYIKKHIKDEDLVISIGAGPINQVTKALVK